MAFIFINDYIDVRNIFFLFKTCLWPTEGLLSRLSDVLYDVGYCWDFDAGFINDKISPFISEHKLT